MAKYLVFVLPFLTLIFPASLKASDAAAVSLPFVYKFNVAGILSETHSPTESSSPYFWLNLGKEFDISGDLGHFEEEVGVSRLITRSRWTNPSQEIVLRINDTDVTDSLDRDAYSGVFLLSRYKDENNYYFVGIRMDGQAVIKKKSNGIFYTLAIKPLFGDPATYNSKQNLNLLPKNKWLVMRSEVKNLGNTAKISLFVDNGKGEQKIIEAVDKNCLQYNANAGIESDYMSVDLGSYTLNEI